jgi:hypothetical protein
MPRPHLAIKKYLKSHEWLETPARSILETWRSSQTGHRYNRKKFAMSYFNGKLKLVDDWATLWNENENFYYELTPNNRSDLATLVSLICGKSVDIIDGYIAEITNDAELRNHIEGALQGDSSLRDVQVAFGRREGWYAFVRALKPKVVVETGVHHGVGACVITAALRRNAADGEGGFYFGTDIFNGAGWLLSGEYAKFGSVLYGDSIESLATLNESVDIFINDSDHSADYEAREYETITSKLAERSLVLGDNAHITSELNKWARSQGRPYVFFKEEPQDHWYPGAGIGISPKNVPMMPIMRGAEEKESLIE